MSINKGRHDESTGGINLPVSTIQGKLAGDSGKAPMLHGNINQPLVAMKLSVADDEIVLHTMFLN